MPNPDADHTLDDLSARFDEVLAQLESVAGWKTARVKRPVLILGSLDGIETGVRQLIRDEPLETTQLRTASGQVVTLPTEAEMLRIKAVLIVKRNATRDYLDFVALADKMGLDAVAQALVRFERLYAHEAVGSPLQQLQAMLASPAPYDLQGTNLAEYKDLRPRWHDWEAVKSVCAEVALRAFDEIARERKPS
jgi:hypothetical protein